MRVAVVAGARPNFVKIAPLVRAMRDAGMPFHLVHTGQHYDEHMSAVFFRQLEIDPPEVNLRVGSATHAEQTGRVMLAFETWALEARPDAVVVVGDVNSSVACSLTASKLGIPVAHVEAGLRSFDRTMPEEVNRVCVDALATWLFTPSPDADDTLIAEGVDPSRIFRVGNIMVDSLVRALDEALALPVHPLLDGLGEYGLVTLHRPALVDDPAKLSSMLGALAEIARGVPLLFPVHPRTRDKIAAAGHDGDRLRLTEPLGYLEFLAVEARARLVITDSGGVQEETTVLGVPCLTVRENTERPITVLEGTNQLVGYDPDRLVAAARAVAARVAEPRRPDLWDGHTAPRIVEILGHGVPLVEWVPPGVAHHAARLGS